MNLQEKLDTYKAGMVKNAPKEALEIMQRATEDLRNSAIMDGVVKVGGTAPKFELLNTAQKPVRLSDLLSDGPLVLRAHSKITSHFMRRCIPPGCVAKARNILIFLRFRALPDSRLNA